MTAPSAGNAEAGRPTPFNVLIAGAGVAGLEAAFALREFAGDRVNLTLLAPTDAFVYRPMTVIEPFNFSQPERYPLSELVEDAGAELIHAGLREVDASRRVARTTSGSELSYDALLIALGTSSHRRYGHVTSIDDTRMDELLHGLVQDVEEGYVHRLAFVIPAPIPWPLPAYELALLTAERAWDMQTEMKVTIITPEPSPLSVFGAQVSRQVAQLLSKRGIEVITSAYCDIPKAKAISIHPGDRRLEADRIVALPELRGPAVAGLPHNATGFLAVDGYGRVPGVDAVWAAGDCTDYAVKHGGIAAQQADAAARSIAERAGAQVVPEEFKPVMTGVLLTADEPIRLGGDTGETDAPSRLGDAIRPSEVSKITARYLAPHLTRQVALRA